MQHRTLTPAEIAAQFAGSTRIAPGIWQDADGNPHFSIPELLAAYDLPDTPAEREAIVQIIREVMQRHAPEAIAVRQDPES